jgi:hypothetical protein
MGPLVKMRNVALIMICHYFDNRPLSKLGLVGVDISAIETKRGYAN